MLSKRIYLCGAWMLEQTAFCPAFLLTVLPGRPSLTSTPLLRGYFFPPISNSLCYGVLLATHHLSPSILGPTPSGHLFLLDRILLAWLSSQGELRRAGSVPGAEGWLTGQAVVVPPPPLNPCSLTSTDLALGVHCSFVGGAGQAGGSSFEY